ncbi:glycoside hydrolase family 95 protein [Arthrobacter glacialis]|uniref:glycoside hydrolase family 95 protein n=1 Tax=Arthrobacter glacialis TaxID=1664 RepID=UPI000CD3D2E4|nr:glycoside hydrolase family 95 protein [Arthrobacter glacialis]POH61268.1 hypothetical protein CVS28_01930 [Arthrobacter glacialis]
MTIAAEGANDGKEVRKNPEKLLSFRKPAEQWLHALPLGNGSLGAMVHGGVQRERIALNLDTFWSGGPRNHNVSGGPDILRAMRGLIFDGNADPSGVDALARQMQGPATESFQPLGDLIIEQLDAMADETSHVYSRELDLSTAVATTHFASQQGGFSREAFCPHADNVLVVRQVSTIKGGLNLRVTLHSVHKSVAAPDGGRSPRPLEQTMGLSGRAPDSIPGMGSDVDAGVSYSQQQGMLFDLAALVTADQGEVSLCADGSVEVRGATTVSILLSAADSYIGWSSAPHERLDDLRASNLAILAAAAELDHEALLARHRDDNSKLFNRVELDLGGTASENASPTDERLVGLRAGSTDAGLAELLFNFGRYLLIASSRPGTKPANLQGIWNADVRPPWRSNWTANINVQMNYWAAETTGLAECHEPLLEFIAELAESGSHTATELYGAGGWTSHHNLDIWGTTWPVGGGDGKPRWSMWPLSAAWLCRHLVDHNDFSPDPAFRRRAWPVIRGAAEFLLDFLVTDPRPTAAPGTLVTAPSTSPEASFIGPDGQVMALGVMTTMDNWLIRELFGSCLRLAATDAQCAALAPDGFSSRLAEALDRLPDIGLLEGGGINEWESKYQDEDPGHRHLSHLYGLYPSNLVDLHQTPRMAEEARLALERRLKSGGGGTGWSQAWVACLWARLGDGSAALRSINSLLSDSVADNLLDLHPPRIFQIDGNFGVAAAMAEMLLQSHSGEVKILPALPPEWPRGSVRGLRARNGLVAAIGWADGVVSFVELEGRPLQVVRLRLPTLSAQALNLDVVHTIQIPESGKYRLNPCRPAATALNHEALAH